jgi:hypothetical protein
MKKLIISIFSLAVLVLLTTACDEATVELDPIGDTEAGFFQNETQMTQAVLGIYQKVGFFYTFRGGQNNFLQGIWLLPSDDITTEAGHAFESFEALNGSNGQLDAFYRFSYQLIARANSVLEKIEENGDFAYENDPELKDIHRGEALFLRAWMYFRLWNTYGTAPLVTDRIVDLDNAYPPNSTGTELLDQAIIDLETAAQLLPESWNSENKGRVTKNSALGLRGKALVFRGTVSGNNADFTTALTDFNAMNGVELAPHYNQNFDVEFENNIESLFEFQASNQANLNNPFLDNDAFAVVGDIGAYYGFWDRRPSWVGNTVYSATPSLMNSYDPEDPRPEYIFVPDPDLVTNVVKYLRNGRLVDRWPGGNGVNRNNPRILRYADVLLLQAEALVRSGGSLSEAVGIINQVRERARNSVVADTIPPSTVPADLNTAESDRNTVLEWVFEERRRELAAEEGHRWYDLRRRHIAGEIDLKDWDFDSKRQNFDFQDQNVNFPLPEIEVLENENLNQNEGY